MKQKLDENLIASLEQTIKLTRETQNNLLKKLEDVKAEINRLFDEAEALNAEINILETSANQTENALATVLSVMSTRNKNGGRK